MADDLDEAPAPEDLEELEVDLDSLDDDMGDELTADDDPDHLSMAEEEEEEGIGDDLEEAEVLTAEPGAALEKSAEAEEEEDEDEEDEDVEASLDVILKERLVVEDEPEDDELAEADDRSEPSEQVLPKQPNEFVCRSCFLVKHPSQLADEKKMLCRDCV